MTILQRVTRFGSGSQVYTFPDTIQTLNGNFGSLITLTSKLPGADGGFDEFGLGVSPAEIGKVSVEFTLISDTREGMTALRDAVYKMRGFGRKQLFMQPSDNALPPRWCWGRVASIPINEKVAKHTDLWQPVTVNFHVPDPMWYAQGTEAVLWGAFNWGDGSVWGGTAPAWAISGELTDQTVTPVGSAIIQPRIKISCGAGQTVTNPTIQRVVNGEVVDQVSYTGTLVASDVLEINCRAWLVKKNSVDAYTSAFSFLHPSWFRLYPGANTVRIRFANSTDAATIRMLYFEGYY